MSLRRGVRLGRYEIVELVGAGGMGEVYRARDTRLDRSVAIKVIGSGYGNHPEMRCRFDTEARLVAQLDHPRIGALFDVGHDEGIDYVVMEFIQGRTLADRLVHGPLVFAELIGYAIEIAAGLGYAHGRGIEHRDLKPGNILLTATGVKIIDFGIGKIRQRNEHPRENFASMKTLPLPTDKGFLPGTTAYLSPERLQGRAVDHRSDIFAFGAVLFEMAAGRRPFDGPTPADVAAAILTADPPPLAAGEPRLAEIDWVVQRCLKKRPEDRWQSMADVEAILKWIARTSSKPAEPRPPVNLVSRSIAVTILAAAAVTGLAWLASRGSDAAPPPPRSVAFSISPLPAGGFTPTESSVQSPQIAVSPDGRYLAFVATATDGVSQVWLRPIDGVTARPLAGTIDATYPFWSPSSRSIGFFSRGQLKRIDVDGGPARTLAPARAGKGGTWSADDTILFSPETNAGIVRIAADGSLHEQTVLSAARHETSHRWPQFLPDGRHYIYFAKSANDAESGIRFASVDGPGDATVVRTGFGAIYAPPAHLLYVSEDALLAAPFDVARGRLLADPVTVVERVATSSNFYAAFSASTNGVLAYATSVSPAELAWTGRDGRRLGTAAGPGQYVDFKLSPDHRYIAAAEVEQHSDRSDLRLIDLARGINLRLTTSPATDASPVWSPDGSRLVFRSNRERQHDLYLRPASGGGADLLFLKTPAAKYPTDWSAAGGFIVYHASREGTHYDVWAAPVDHPTDSQPLVQTEFDDVQGQVSPTGRWLAYSSNQSSRFEVYVQPVHGDGRRWQVSVAGGSDPKWRADEKELFYVDGNGQIMSVALSSDAGFEPGIPKPLFRLPEIAVIPPYLSAYDVQPDGQRFVVRASTEQVQTHPLNVVVNWSPGRTVK